MTGDARAYVLSAAERAVYDTLPAAHRRQALAKCRHLALKAPELRDYYEAHAAYIEQLLVAASQRSTDGREALRVRLADAALHTRVPTAPTWSDLDEYIRDVWLSGTRDLVDTVVAYGDEREAAGREAEWLRLGGYVARCRHCHDGVTPEQSVFSSANDYPGDEHALCARLDEKQAAQQPPLAERRPS